MEQQKLCPARRTGGRSAEEKGGKPSKNQCLNLPKPFPTHLGNYKVWNPSKKYPAIGNVEDPYFYDTTIGEVGLTSSVF